MPLPCSKLSRGNALVVFAQMLNLYLLYWVTCQRQSNAICSSIQLLRCWLLRSVQRHHWAPPRKTMIALFTYMTTRAAHLEVVEDLSTDAFLICFRNHLESYMANHLESYMAKYNIEWLFNCPSNPSAGGCWERLVQIVKRLLHHQMKLCASRNNGELPMASRTDSRNNGVSNTNQSCWIDQSGPTLQSLCEPNQCRSLWKTARIIKTFKGKDGQVKTVQARYHQTAGDQASSFKVWEFT